MRIFILFFTLLFSSQLWAEIQWIGNEQGYKLNASTLFKMRKELSKEEQNQLKTLRNVTFENRAAFKDALDKQIGSQHPLSKSLVEKAMLPAISYGVEERSHLLSLIVSDGDHHQDQNSFTQKSWLKLPAVAKTTQLQSKFNNQCLQISAQQKLLFELCSGSRNGEEKSAYLKTAANSILGLGQEFVNPGATNANRLGETRHGKNTMSGFNGGFNGNTLFPIAYFDFPASEHKQPFALILDNRYPQNWDFSSTPYKLSVGAGDFKLHVLTGKTLADIRRSYMLMAGTPLLPPKSAFGLWLSEYGFDNWAELDQKIATLKKNNFPLSGVVLDLQWFGGISE
ncbi:TIM-barrel domain-containing protein, partial [Psychromonas sp.]|uniref:TIM-barrel domain-containing protein n=1 Tax=Psychromonas sp. TaxID=1884585 RepID=UPI0039E3EC4C